MTAYGISDVAMLATAPSNRGGIRQTRTMAHLWTQNAMKNVMKPTASRLPKVQTIPPAARVSPPETESAALWMASPAGKAEGSSPMKDCCAHDNHLPS